MPDFAPVAARARAVLSPAGPLRRYAFVSLVDATGTGMFLAVSVLFFTRFAGLFGYFFTGAADTVKLLGGRVAVDVRRVGIPWDDRPVVNADQRCAH